MNTTYEEIKSQYVALKKTVEYMKEKQTEITSFFEHLQTRSFVFIGSGSSYYVSQSAEMIVKTEMGLPASSMPAGDVMVNYESYRNIFSGSTVVAISRSGNTTEIINTINTIKKDLDVSVLGITCVENSDLNKVADLTLNLPWAFDQSVCQTRTITNLYTVVALIVAALSKNKSISDNIEKVIVNGDKFLSDYEDTLKSIGYEHWDKVVVLADGKITGIATEAALAFNEIAKVPSNYYHLLDARHGPAVLLDQNTLVIAAISKGQLEYQLSLIHDFVNKGCIVIACKDKSIHDIDSVRLNVTYETDLDDISVGIPFVNVSQLISYYKAQQKGLNPDEPEGLDAWIKL
jgi:glucosamine--fructose-6-phosphate aminotransferase (isomerizing)